ncbi:gastrula zinc finger protein XlCGF57.1-like [Plodia interpunctella]|uniref:gastrula zinc finger protein XlCGF57.1-like n=1 Tax=Plodia interpunctella TaxID=58824 RepID=UPI00236879E9|nr:gastrula zinc finger protein XlCGF57.1-like [Plodia interpunctella]
MSLKTNSCTSVCRICLAIDSRTFLLSGTHLQLVFEKITNTALHTQDQRPVAACYLCYHQLKKSCKLIQMSTKAENILTDIFSRCNKITRQSISLVQRHADKKLYRSLSFSKIDYCDVTIPEKVKIEVKVERDIEKENKMNTEICDSEEDTEVDVGLNDPVSLGSFNVMTHHIIDLKEEENLEDGDFAETNDILIENDQYLIPIKSKSQPRLHKCNICPKRYVKRFHLWRHLMVHTGEKPFKCRVCSAKFRTKYHMDRHLICIHNLNKDPYKCDKCGSKFQDRNELRKHVKTHIFECDYCHQQIKVRTDFIHHLKSHKEKTMNETRAKLQKCPFCDVELFEAELKRHTRIHKKNRNCSVCNRRFKKYYELQQHFRTHTGERPFECDQCHKRFMTKPHLKIHLKLHTGEKPFKCEVCELSFIRRSQLNTHMRTHTGEKNFECSVCQRRFRYKHILVLHMRTHTGEKPFKCSVCDKRFIARMNMSRHIAKIHNEKKKIVND